MEKYSLMPFFENNLKPLCWNKVLGIFIILLAFPVFGEVEKAFNIDIPLECKTPEECPIQNHVDVHLKSNPKDPKDYKCGSLVYGGHKGIDFRVKTNKSLEKKIKILAVAPGVIKAIRNDMVENLPLDSLSLQGKECGNGVVIDHEEGWETQYCHMKKGSIQVSLGQKIERGQLIGHMGRSGKTQFPHIHLSIRKNGTVVDPYIGVINAETQCGKELNSIWSQKAQKIVLPYQSTGVLKASFSSDLPTQETLMEGKHVHKKLSPPLHKFVFWVYLFGVRQGDEEEFEIRDPQDKIILKKRSQALKKNKATWLSFAGKKVLTNQGQSKGKKQDFKEKGIMQSIKEAFNGDKSEREFPKEGTYVGHYRLFRKDSTGKEKVIIDISRKVEIDFKNSKAYIYSIE